MDTVRAGLEESFFRILPDRNYRKQARNIVIAQVESLVPLHTTFDPYIYGGGTPKVTWRYVQKFFERWPGARNGQLPMHFFSEYIGDIDDYVIYVGEAITNRSWFLQAAVAAGALPPQYADAVLVVVQENYGVETIELRLWRLLADRVITPVARLEQIPRANIQFFEKIANRTVVNGPNWSYRFREPTFLDPFQLELLLKEYEKR